MRIVTEVNFFLHWNLVLSNEFIKVELPPWKIWKADISSVSLSSFALTKANSRSVSCLKPRARFFIQNSGMRMTRMKNVRVFLCCIPIPECIEHHSNHSAPRGRMNRMLWMKIQDGGRRDERCGFKHVSTALPEEKSGKHLYQHFKCTSGQAKALFGDR